MFFNEWVHLSEFDTVEKNLDLVRGNKINKKGIKKNPNIVNYITFIHIQKNILVKKIIYKPLNKEIKPFNCRYKCDKFSEKGKITKAPTWWGTYNKVKHDGFKYRNSINLDAVLKALSALFLLHCMNWNNLKFALIKYNMVMVTNSALSSIDGNIDKLGSSNFKIIRTPDYFRHVLFEYERKE